MREIGPRFQSFLSRSKTPRNILTGMMFDRPLWMFDFEYRVYRNRSSQYYATTAARIDTEGLGLPSFSMTLGTFGSSFTSDIDFGSAPMFSDHYHLIGDNEEDFKTVQRSGSYLFHRKTES